MVIIFSIWLHGYIAYGLLNDAHITNTGMFWTYLFTVIFLIYIFKTPSNMEKSIRNAIKKRR